MREDGKTMLWMRGQTATIKRGREGWQMERVAMRCRSIFPDRPFHVRTLIQGRQEPRRRWRDRKTIRTEATRFEAGNQFGGVPA